MIFALVIAAVIVVVCFAQPTLFREPRAQDLILRVFLTAIGVGALGGVVMTPRERNPLWLLATLAAGGIGFLMLLLGAGLGSASMH